MRTATPRVPPVGSRRPPLGGRVSPAGRLRLSGFWGGHQYYERIDKTSNPNSNDESDKFCFQEGCFFGHDVADFGFLDLVRLGVLLPNDSNVSTSLSPTASASDANSTVQVTINGHIYFHRYNHDNYGENNDDCSGFPVYDADR